MIFRTEVGLKDLNSHTYSHNPPHHASEAQDFSVDYRGPQEDII